MSTHPYTRLFTKLVAPTPDDDETLGYEVGDVWHDEGGSVYDCRDASEGAAVWDERGSGSGTDWGDIGGTLSDQTDLQSALDAKQPLDSDLTAIAGLTPSNDDILQRKTGAWTNRSLAQLITDLALGTFSFISSLAHGSLTSVGANDHHNEDHDHDGSPTQKLAQANTHESPDTDTGTSSLHHTIGSGANQAAAGNHNHSGTYQPLDSDLTAIAGLSPADDDIIQRKSGAWTNRTLAQLITDLTSSIQTIASNIIGKFQLSGDITPTALSGNVNDYDPTGWSTASTLRLESSGSARTITGLAGGADGRVAVLMNIGATFYINLASESASSSAANRFSFGSATFPLAPGRSVILIYDSTAQRWIPSLIHEHQQMTGVGAYTHTNIDNHINDSNNPHGVTAPQADAIPEDGWIAGTGTWSYSSADSPIFVASVPDADAANISVGYRFKLTQTSVKYFIVHAKGSPSGGFTPITIHGGTDYTLANAAITSPYYSPVKSPLGFPMDDDKWTVSASNTANAHKTPPTQNVWYGGAGLTNTGISIDVPIGAWRGFGKAVLESEDTTVTDYNCYMTFSNANNSESNSDHTGFIALTVPSGTYKIWSVMVLPLKVTVASKTTMYLNIKTSTTTADAIHMRGDVVPTIIKLVDNYL